MGVDFSPGRAGGPIWSIFDTGTLVLHVYGSMGVGGWFWVARGGQREDSGGLSRVWWIA